MSGPGHPPWSSLMKFYQCTALLVAFFALTVSVNASTPPHNTNMNQVPQAPKKNRKNIYRIPSFQGNVRKVTNAGASAQIDSNSSSSVVVKTEAESKLELVKTSFDVVKKENDTLREEIEKLKRVEIIKHAYGVADKASMQDVLSEVFSRSTAEFKLTTERLSNGRFGIIESARKMNCVVLLTPHVITIDKVNQGSMNVGTYKRKNLKTLDAAMTLYPQLFAERLADTVFVILVNMIVGLQYIHESGLVHSKIFKSEGEGYEWTDIIMFDMIKEEDRSVSAQVLLDCTKGLYNIPTTEPAKTVGMDRDDMLCVILWVILKALKLPTTYWIDLYNGLTECEKFSDFQLIGGITNEKRLHEMVSQSLNVSVAMMLLHVIEYYFDVLKAMILKEPVDADFQTRDLLFIEPIRSKYTKLPNIASRFKL